MKIRETLLGVLVLGLVLGGVYWSRTRSGGTTHSAAAPAQGEGMPATPATPAQGPAMGAGQHTGGHAGQPMADDAAVPDVTTADASTEANGLRITLSLATRPPVAFSKKHFRVRAESNGVPATLDEGTIVFEMDMPMGDHRYSLVGGQDGWYTADAVLPFCASGNPRWYATVSGSVNGTRLSAKFQVNLTKP